MHAIAKALYEAMKAEKLDTVTYSTFKWLRNRKTAAEQEEEANSEGRSPSVVSTDILQRNKQSDKGRVRRIKDKVWRVLKLPQITR